MTKNLKLLVFLFVFMAQSTMMLAQGAASEEICLEYRTTPKLNGNMGPSRAPAKQSVKRTITAFLDESAGQLAVTNTANAIYSYYVCDVNGTVYSQGLLSFSAGNTLYIDINHLPKGEYYLVMQSGSTTVSGLFYL